ncbi:MAG: GrdX protein [Tissierellia bacterium]|nr:GrdX protein [Tissierellia bacterium]
MKRIIVTNNRYVYEKFKDTLEMEYYEDFTYLDILSYVRDKIHEGYKLITHPLSGSVKPNETPYKSIVIGEKSSALDLDSLRIIEESIATTKKFISNKPTPNWTETVLDDFRVIDLSLITGAIERMIDL